MGDRFLYSRTFRLSPQPSLLSGLGRLMDFGGALSSYNRDETPSQADINALKADWQMIGQDLCTAIENERKKQDAR